MANQNELDELRDRIGKLRLSDQLHLFELVLGDYRQRCEEATTEMLAQQRELLASAELRRALATPFVFPPEGKREAG